MISTIERDFIVNDGVGTFPMKELPNWYGISDVGFIWHGEWSDSEIEYKGKTIYELSDEPCAHRECPYKYCVYHEFYDSDRESTINTPTTVRELDTCMNWLDI